MDVGVRVIRGPSWSWDDQDGGFVGTVVKPFESSLNVVQSGTVFVQWDNGLTGNYRVGRDGGYDLLILDSGPAGIRFPGTECDECGQKILIGTRWKCAVCSNYDLCHTCYHNDKHNLMHHFIRYDSPSTTGIEVHSRTNSEKSEVRGIFPGATVVRRVEDWLHGQNDGGMGGMPGTVLVDPPTRLLNSNRGSIMVLWENGDTVEHSCGNDGKVAVKCVTAAEGKEYYVQHLAVLVGDQFIVGFQNFIRGREEENQSPPLEVREDIGPIDPSQSIDKGDESFLPVQCWPGDRVQVNMDVSVFRALQDELHGGWNVEMELCIGATGVVLEVSPRIAIVHYKSLKKKWAINPEALTKKMFAAGDQVRILADEKRVKSLQKGHGGWVQKMQEDLGKLAEVTGTGNGGRVLVKVGSRPYRWTLNANCCTLIESETGFVGGSDSDDDSDTGVPSMFMDTLLSHHSELVQPQLLVEFSATNKVPLVKAIVEKYPHLINIKNKGKTALHLSCLKGHVDVVRILLNAGANITATDDEGNTPVHYSVHRKDDPSALEVILERGAASGDLINFKLISVLHLAVHRRHPQCVRTLVKHGCNVNIQDANGDTPLHDAITVENRDSIEVLANCPRFNFALMNEKGLTVLQLAAFKGDSFAVEQIVKNAQHLVNQQKGDGFTALHIACINGHRDAAEMLISKGHAAVELKNRERHTPLMIALSRANVSTMELLIMKGANPNTCDGDGDSCLHWILKLITSFQMGIRDSQNRPTVDLYDAPEITSIVTQLPPGVREPTWVGVALFLVQHGADIFQQNSSGISPIQLLHDQKITDLLIEAQKRCQRRVNPPRKDTPVIPRPFNSFQPKMMPNPVFYSTAGPSNPSPQPSKPSTSVHQSNPAAVRPNNAASIRPNNPTAVRPNNPTAVRPNNPASVRPKNPTAVRPNNPASVRPNNPPAIRPNNTTAIRPNNPTAVHQSNPASVRPNNSTAVRPNNQASLRPDNSASALSSPSSSSSSSGCRQDQDIFRAEAECAMCSEARVEVVFRPCGHAIACQSCSFRMKKCPKCRTVILEKILTQK